MNPDRVRFGRVPDFLGKTAAMGEIGFNYLPLAPALLALGYKDTSPAMEATLAFGMGPRGHLPSTNTGVGCDITSFVAGCKNGQRAHAGQLGASNVRSGGGCGGSSWSWQGQIKSIVASIMAKPESHRSQEENDTLALVLKYLAPREQLFPSHGGNGLITTGRTFPKQHDAKATAEAARPQAPSPAAASAKEQKNLKERERYALKKGTLEEILAKKPEDRTPGENVLLDKARDKKRKNSRNDSQRYAAKKRRLGEILAKAPTERDREETRQLERALARKRQKSRIDARWIAKRRAEERARWARQKACRGVVEPRENDVLLGKGREQHPGNKIYRRLVEENKERYLSASSADRGAVASHIVQSLKALNPPGRFMEQDVATKLWYDVGADK